MKSPWGKHPRIQLLTIEDLLGGKSIDYPQDYRRDFQEGAAGEDPIHRKSRRFYRWGVTALRKSKFRLSHVPGHRHRDMGNLIG